MAAYNVTTAVQPALSYAHCSLRARVVRVVRRVGRRVSSDALAWAVALPVAMFLQQDFAASQVAWRRAAAVAALPALVQSVTGITAILRWGRGHAGSFGEALGTTAATAAATLIFFAANATIGGGYLPVSVPVIAGFVTVGLQMLARSVHRVVTDGRRRPDPRVSRRVLVFGAGEAGAHIITAMLRDKQSPFLPVAVLDDDAAKADLRLHGVPVVGARDEIALAAATYDAVGIVIAVPSGSPDLIRDVSARAADAGLAVRVLPKVSEVVGGSLGIKDIRPLTELDLLGRQQLDTDVRAIAGYITGKRVLITGAGGSIGSELCRQVSRFNPAELVMLDRDESALHAVQLSMQGRARLDDPNLVVADIRDRDRIHEVFIRHLPDVVFHAAALKHLTLLEMHPSEAVKTNVIGTQNVLDAAVAAGVRTLVNISTDKAANPTSVLGYSKRVAERITAAVRVEGSTFLSVRFGNVLGSRGSVLTVFRHQIASGGPVTVTDPNVTRFFMTIEEAVQLVIQAGAIGRPSEVLVLDMGEPVCIADVAKRLIEASGKDIPVEFTGLRPGEKVHEELFGDGEADVRPSHPLISQVRVPPLPMAAIETAATKPSEIARLLPGLCRSFVVALEDAAPVSVIDLSDEALASR